VGDYALAPDAASFSSCAGACTTIECYDACVSSYPIAGNAFDTLIACQDQSCAEPCICEAAANDTVCDTCNKTSCCSEYVDYYLAPDLQAFIDCANLCEDQLCVDECVDQYPETGAAYYAWSDCLDASCLDECPL
jgi:hypothetical protein